MILQFCRCGGLFDAKGNPDGFLSHYPSLRNFRPGGFFDSLKGGKAADGCAVSAAAFFSRTAGFSKAFFREIPLMGCGRRKKWLACRKARALVRIPEQVQQPVPLLRKLV